jgi:hypothetical protein
MACIGLFFLIRIVGGGVHIECPRGTAGMYWRIIPVPGDCEDGEVGGMKGGWQGKPKYSEKTCPGATLSTTDPTCQTRARTRAAAVGSQRLSASAMARPFMGQSARPNFLGEESKNHFHIIPDLLIS